MHGKWHQFDQDCAYRLSRGHHHHGVVGYCAAVGVLNVRKVGIEHVGADGHIPEKMSSDDEAGDTRPTNKFGPSVPMLSQLGRRDRWTDQTLMADQSEAYSIPRMPTYHLRSFAQSKSITGRTSPSATLMTHMLTSFPRAMYSPGSLPPFIHPYSLGNNAHNPNEGFESLTTCVTLMQMVSGAAPGSRKLFWKNVRLECERLQVEVFLNALWPLKLLTDRCRCSPSTSGLYYQRCKH